MMNKKTDVLAGILVASLLFAGPPAQADTIHDQSMVDVHAYGWDSVGGGATTQQIADDFRPAFDGSISILNWTGKYHDYFDVSAKKFEIRIFSDAGKKPGHVIFSQFLQVAGNSTGGVDGGSDEILTYTTALTGSPVLKAEKTYWLSIRESDPATSAKWSWSFHNSNFAGGFSYRQKDTAPWATGTEDMAYSLSITPPKLGF